MKGVGLIFMVGMEYMATNCCSGDLSGHLAPALSMGRQLSCAVDSLMADSLKPTPVRLLCSWVLPLQHKVPAEILSLPTSRMDHHNQKSNGSAGKTAPAPWAKQSKMQCNKENEKYTVWHLD